MIRPAEFWYAYMNPPINPIKPPVTIDGPLIPGLIPIFFHTQMIQHFIVQFSFRNLRNRFEKVVREREMGYRRGSRRWRRRRWWRRSGGSRGSWSFRRLWWTEGPDLRLGTLASPMLWCLCSSSTFFLLFNWESQTHYLSELLTVLCLGWVWGNWDSGLVDFSTLLQLV